MEKLSQNIALENMSTSFFKFPNVVENSISAQKFVLVKSKNGFHFGSMPLGEAKEHKDIIAALEKEIGEKLESFGGGWLKIDGFDNQIVLDDASYSQNKEIGHLKISWEELRQIVQNIVGEKYKVVVSD